MRGRRAARGVAELVEPRQRQVGGILRQFRLLVAGCQQFRAAERGGAAEHHQIDQRIRAEPVGAVHRHAGRFAERHQAGDHGVGVAVLLGQRLAVIIRGDAAHVVVHGRQHRDRLARHVDIGEDARGLADAGQPLVQHLGIEMVEMQEQMVLFLADAAAFADLDGHGARDHVARGKILGRRRVALHEALAFGIDQIAAFAARAFGDQAAGRINAGRMELHEFHVLQRQAGAQHHGVAVAGADMRRGAGEIGAAITAGGEDRHVGAEAMDGAVIHIERDHAAAAAFVVHDQVDGEIFDVELGGVLERLAVHRVQHGVAGAVGGGAGALRGALAVMRGHAAERALIDLAVFLAARERQAPVLEFVDRGRRVAAEIFDGVLVAEPVGALDGVVHVPAPVVLAHIAERGGDAALRRHGVRARREYFGDAGGAQVPPRCSRPRRAGRSRRRRSRPRRSCDPRSDRRCR